MLCFLPLSIVGYAIIRTTKENSVKYGALFLMASGLYPSGECPPIGIDESLRCSSTN